MATAKEAKIELARKAAILDVNKTMALPYKATKAIKILKEIDAAAKKGDEATDVLKSMQVINDIFSEETQEKIGAAHDYDQEKSWGFYTEVLAPLSQRSSG